MSMSPSSGLIPPSVLQQLREFGFLSLEARTKGTPVNDPPVRLGVLLQSGASRVAVRPRTRGQRTHAAAGDDPYARFGGYLVFAEFDPSSKEPLFLNLCDACTSEVCRAGDLTGYRPSAGSRRTETCVCRSTA